MKTKALKVFEAAPRGPLVIKFDSKKTANEVYNYTIDSIDKAFGAIIALGNPELMRQGELRLQEFAARLHNAQAKVSGRPLERGTYEELNGRAV